jgi:glyoxylase-like metal-dependent hydrolase (beta-lactamase superfamily II)
MRLFGCVCGQFHSDGTGLGMPAGRVAVPVPFYVIEHPEGVTLFDCGLHANVADADDDYRKRLQAGGADVSFGPEETVARHLERLDIDPDRVRYVVVSHLHFDHAGGLHQVPNATLVVQQREWEAGFDSEIAARYFLPRRYFDLGHKVQLVDGEHDLFGDGSVVCLPSYGHTPGHQSLRVRSAEGDPHPGQRRLLSRRRGGDAALPGVLGPRGDEPLAGRPLGAARRRHGDGVRPRPRPVGRAPGAAVREGLSLG